MGTEVGPARATALRGVELLAKDDIPGAKTIVLAVDPAGDRHHGEVLAGGLPPDGELFGALRDDEVDVVVAQFFPLGSVWEHHTQRLLAAAARRRPLSWGPDPHSRLS